MDNAAHTPGPWIIRAGHPCDVEAPETGHVASCETKEDARLIAAAPRMLAALKTVEEWWLNEEMGRHRGAPYAIFAARAAVREAKGETP